MWADDTYEKVTSTSGLVSGAQYLIVFESGNSSYAMGAETGSGSKTYRNRVAVSVSNSQIVITNQTPVVFTLGTSGDNYTFYGSDNKYLAKTSTASNNNNYLNSSATDCLVLK